jgi:hypothetical protein
MWAVLVENTYEEQKISTDSAHMTWTALTQEMLLCVVFNLWVLISEAIVMYVSRELLHETDSDNRKEHRFCMQKEKNKLHTQHCVKKRFSDQDPSAIVRIT